MDFSLPQLAAVRVFARRLPGWAVQAARAWFRFFWSQGRTGKFVTTVVTVIVLWIVLEQLPLDPARRSAIVDVTAVALAFLLVFSLLFSPTRRR